MNKNIFKNYIDACELEKEIEERIRKLEEENSVRMEFQRYLRKL